MALPSRYGIEKKINSMEGLSAYENGGKGSGNFGHSGRPGEVGGSSSGGVGKSRESEEKDDAFHSRYEGGSAPIQYDGDTFYPDKDGRGMTTKDGKRTMMFPDEVLHARQEIVDNWKKEGITEASYEHAKQLYFKILKDSTITDQDLRDKKHATELADELGGIIRRYEDEHPERFLK